MSGRRRLHFFPFGMPLGWGQVFYPAFVFFVLLLLAAVAAYLNPDVGIPSSTLAVAWMIIQTSVSCMFVASLSLIFGRLVKVLHLILVVYIEYIIAINLLELFARGHFNDEVLDDGCVWLLVLRNSSWSEISEFLSGNVGAIEWLVMVVYVVSLIAIIVFILRISVGSPRIKSLMCNLVCCLVFIIAFNPSFQYADLFSQTLLSPRKLGLFKEFAEGFTFDSLAAIGQNKPDHGLYVAECAKEDQPFGVVVIGESATRCHWSLYGYSRRTTPMVEALANEIVVFSSVRASYWLTIQAMISMLTGKHHLEAGGCCALPSIIRSVGLSCCFLSGQNHWGHWDGADSLLFSQCDSTRYLAELHDTGSCWDHDLVEEMAPDVANECVNLCFVHLMGSHFNFANRYPMSFSAISKDVQDEISDAYPSLKDTIVSYDNSIAYTDMVLGDMIGVVRRLRPCSFVLYVSDHGETPESSNRDVTQESLWDVPMIVWTSEEYRRRFPEVLAALERRKNENMTNAAVFGIVLDLMRIRETNSNE